ncbi:hypothetical protein PVAND_000908 [Polypedilum vanderplanki]|uniref:Uncharacterized protein n=1 Tax=Polypedilum vanderplanki TaxID=319348 RepID=A0A9J6BLC3_POLVA|nr:hypothetical protein PVAND_000908 [Polypedilum vanderplanki]
MQLKVESEMPSSERAARGQDRCNRTSSVYISNGSSVQSSNNSDVLEHQKPVLTIQVNQNQNNNSSNNETANNLVNIVSCFRATTTAAITHNGSSSNGIENLVHNNSNLPFNVSVNKNYDNNSSDRSEESLMNNKNNQNIVNIVENYDPNEITIAPNVTSTVDYSNVTLVDQSVGLIAEKIDSNAATAAAASESVINQITIVNDNGGDTIAVESVNNQNAKVVDENSQTFREQRRRERRERRQARQRAAQHGHHRHHMSMVHSSSRTNVSRGVNGMEQTTARVNGYEMLPDIINNHLPPPYSTLPIHQIPPSLIPTQPPPSHLPPPPPPIITAAPLPVVVDDCRFSFPIPIIRR